MPQGFETREEVQDRLAPTGQARAASIPLAPVLSPKPVGVRGIGNASRDLADALGTVQGVFDSYVAKKHDQWTIEGQMAYAEGKTEAEIAESGNKFTIAGYQTMKLKSAGNQWYQDQLASIDAEDHAMSPEDYRTKLQGGFTNLLDIAGDDEASRAMLTSIASENMPKLVAKQTETHNAYNKENTRTAFTDVLVSEDTPEGIKELTDPANSMFNETEHMELVGEAISIQLKSGNRDMFDTLAPGESVEDFVQAGYSHATAINMFNALQTNRNLNATKFNEQRIATEAGIVENAASHLNPVQAYEEIKKTQESMGMPDSWANNMWKNASTVMKKQADEVRENVRISDAVTNGDLSLLTGESRKKGFSMARSTAMQQAMADPRVQNAPDDQKQQIAFGIGQDNYYTELHAQNDLVDPTVKFDMNAFTATTLFDDEGQLNENAALAFDSYEKMVNIGGRAFADKYLEPGYTRDVILLSRSYALDDNFDSTAALTLAAAELENITPVTPEHLKDVKAVYSEEDFLKAYNKAMDNVIRPGTLVGRNLGRALDKPATANFFLDFKPAEIENALDNPRIKALTEIEVRKEWSKLPKGLSNSTKAKLAMQNGVANVAAGVVYVNGELITNNPNNTVTSIAARAGVEGKRGAIDVGFRTLMKAVGPEFYGDDYNGFQVFDKPVENTGFTGLLRTVRDAATDVAFAGPEFMLTGDAGKVGESIHDKFRGVPSMNIVWHEESGNMIVRPYTDKERYGVIDDPLIIPVELLGDLYKSVEEGNTDKTQELVNQFRQQVGITPTTIQLDSTVEIEPLKMGGQEAKIATPPSPSFLKHLEEREGSRNKVYRDSLGKLTVGVGHLVTSADNLKEGDVISDQDIQDLLTKDSAKAWDAAVSQAKDLGITDEAFIDALGSVNFQLGTSWFKDHKATWKKLKNGNYEAAALEAEDSSWFKQTPVRVQDFQAAIRTLAVPLPTKKP